jgi:hypothetical protein
MPGRVRVDDDDASAAARKFGTQIDGRGRFADSALGLHKPDYRHGAPSRMNLVFLWCHNIVDGILHHPHREMIIARPSLYENAARGMGRKPPKFGDLNVPENPAKNSELR